MDWTWGGEVAIGYRFGCCCEWGVEGTYWGLAESSTDGGPNCPGPYGTPFTMGLTSMLSTTGGLITGRTPPGSARPINGPTTRRIITSGGPGMPRTWNSTSCGHSAAANAIA